MELYADHCIYELIKIYELIIKKYLIKKIRY